MKSPRKSIVNRQVAALPPSGIREFFDLVQQIEGVISLGVGEPDFSTPWGICDAAIEGMRRGLTSYTSNAGLFELRESIAQDIYDRCGVEYDPATEIVITAGVSEPLDIALRALLEPGDEVIVPQPCYVSYVPCVLLVGGQVRTVENREEDEFKLQADAVSQRVTEHTRALLMGYPNNPTGAVMSHDDLLSVAEVADRHDIIVISDEIYSHLTYEGTHVCFPALPGMKKRTILLDGFSKAYAMTGWRLGYACGPAELIEAMVRIHSYTALCSSVIAQYAALEALRTGGAQMRQMVRAYDERRKVFVEGLREIGLRCFEPKGAFYAFPSIRDVGISSQEFARRLLLEEQVAVVPGTAFGDCGEGYVRCTYASGMDQLREALVRMGRFISRVRSAAEARTDSRPESHRSTAPSDAGDTSLE